MQQAPARQRDEFTVVAGDHLHIEKNLATFPCMAKRAQFQEILPLLVSTYQQGRLVPFLGAGMSAPMLTLWKDFVEKLQHKAVLLGQTDRLILDGAVALPRPDKHSRAIWPSLDAAAQRACSFIQNSIGRNGFLDAVRDALKTSCQTVPESTSSLAKIRWPLVVSTNYDDLFLYACKCRLLSADESSEMRVEVLGRSARDCKLVVSSLTGPFDRQYIWHVQGFLGGQSPNGNLEKDVPNIKVLQDQLVIGHAEYRRVTNRAPDFRRCFAEVFNTRSFLFLGSSLKEEYFLALFGEVLDLCGPSAVPHFAFTKEGQVDADFLADQMNITVCEFPKGSSWEKLPNWLDYLKKEIDKPKARSIRWSFAIEQSSETGSDLEIVRGFAPLALKEGEALAFVAHRENDLPVPPPPFVHLTHVRPRKIRNYEHIFYYQGRCLYAVTARCREDDDDSAVYQAANDLLEVVRKISPATTTLHFQFSPTGGTVPPLYAFIEVVRTFGQWEARRPEHKAPLHLVLYIQSDVDLCLTSGRIDIPELLASKLIRFWVVVISREGQEPVRRSMHCCADTALAEVLSDVGIPANSQRWFASICPSPRKEPLRRTSEEIWDLTITRMGIAFGSVLLLEYETLGKFAERYTAAWCDQDGARVASFYSANGSLCVNGGPAAIGRAAIAGVAQRLMNGFPKLKVFMDDVSSEDNPIMHRWTLVAAHSGPGGARDRVQIRGFEQWKIGADGLIAESQGRFDIEELQHQLECGVNEPQ